MNNFDKVHHALSNELSILTTPHCALFLHHKNCANNFFPIEMNKRIKKLFKLLAGKTELALYTPFLHFVLFYPIIS